MGEGANHVDMEGRTFQAERVESLKERARPASGTARRSVSPAPSEARGRGIAAKARE